MKNKFQITTREKFYRILWGTPFIPLIVLLLSALGISQELSLTASVSKNPVGVNQQFQYQLEVKGGFQSIPNPELPDFTDFHIISGPNVSSSFQYINGQVTSSKVFS
ncbi:MAG: hypothetical protein D6748_14060, partial [Calditrichaeota bacterium]